MRAQMIWLSSSKLKLLAHNITEIEKAKLLSNDKTIVTISMQSLFHLMIQCTVSSLTRFSANLSSFQKVCLLSAILHSLCLWLFLSHGVCHCKEKDIFCSQSFSQAWHSLCCCTLSDPLSASNSSPWPVKTTQGFDDDFDASCHINSALVDSNSSVLLHKKWSLHFCSPLNIFQTRSFLPMLGLAGLSFLSPVLLHAAMCGTGIETVLDLNLAVKSFPSNDKLKNGCLSMWWIVWCLLDKDRRVSLCTWLVTRDTRAELAILLKCMLVVQRTTPSIHWIGHGCFWRKLALHWSILSFLPKDVVGGETIGWANCWQWGGGSSESLCECLCQLQDCVWLPPAPFMQSNWCWTILLI